MLSSCEVMGEGEAQTHHASKKGTYRRGEGCFVVAMTTMSSYYVSIIATYTDKSGCYISSDSLKDNWG